MIRKPALAALILFLVVCQFPKTLGADSDIRWVSVAAYVDREIWERDGPEKTEKKILNTLSFVSEVFTENFGIAFALSQILLWDFPKGKKYLEGELAFVNVEYELGSKPHKDIKVGFTEKMIFLCKYLDDTAPHPPPTTLECEPGQWRRPAYGVSAQFANSAVVTLDKDADYHTLHELGHIFGAKHAQGNSIMADKRTTNFDPENAAIIKNNRLRPFPVTSP